MYNHGQKNRVRIFAIQNFVEIHDPLSSVSGLTIGKNLLVKLGFFAMVHFWQLQKKTLLENVIELIYYARSFKIDILNALFNVKELNLLIRSWSKHNHIFVRFLNSVTDKVDSDGVEACMSCRIKSFWSICEDFSMISVDWKH